MGVQSRLLVDGDREMSVADWAAARGIIRPKSIGQFTIGSGRIERPQALDTTGRTWQVRRLCPLPFDRVRFRLASGYLTGAATPNVVAAVAGVGGLTDADTTAATPTQASWSSSGSLVMATGAAAGRAARPWSDWINCRSRPRTDSGPGYWLSLRAYIAMGAGTGNVALMGDSGGVNTFTGWATDADRPFDITTKGGGFATPAGWNGMTVASGVAAATTCPIVEVQVAYRGLVYNIGGFGDSITDGAGIGNADFGKGWGYRAAIALSKAANLNGIPFEWTNYGWSGLPMASIAQNAADILAGGTALDMCFLPSGSPNSLPDSGAITDAHIEGMAYSRSDIEQRLLAAGIDPILWTMLSSNTAAKNYGATDSKLVAYNSEIRAMASYGRPIADFYTVLSGITTGGQVQMLAGSTNDDIHPNATGHDLLSGVAQSIVRRRINLQSGAALLA